MSLQKTCVIYCFLHLQAHVTTLGVDPGIRTGVKLAVVNQSGDVVAHSTVYPFAPKEDKAGAIEELARLCREHNVDLIAIGNGTASRETEAVGG